MKKITINQITDAQGNTKPLAVCTLDGNQVTIEYQEEWFHKVLERGITGSGGKIFKPSDGKEFFEELVSTPDLSNGRFQIVPELEETR